MTDKRGNSQIRLGGACGVSSGEGVKSREESSKGIEDGWVGEGCTGGRAGDKGGRRGG